MKRVFAVILCFCLVMTLLPVTASASKGIARDGHARLMAIDASARHGGDYAFNDNILAPSHLGWIGAGAYIEYDLVEVSDAAYVQICAAYHQTSNTVEVYLDDGETPIATFNSAYDNTFHLLTEPLSEALTGTHTVTVRVTAGSPDISWIRFLTEEEKNFVPIEISLVGDSNVEIGNYYNGFCSLVDPDRYVVRNYGHSGATVQSYQSTEKYQNAMADASDYYIITLGTNDAMMSEANIQAQTGTAYRSLISAIRNANPNAVIFAQTPLPLREPDREDGTNPGDPDGRTEAKITDIIIPAIKEACAEENIPVIDIFNSMLNSGFERTQYLSDYVHVNQAGGKIMATFTYEAVFGTPDLGEGTEPGTVEAVTITAPKTELGKKGETMQLTASGDDVYWQVRSMDGGSSTCAAIDESGLLTAVLPGAYQVVAISKKDTSVKDAVNLYNRFPYVLAEIDYIFGSNYRKMLSYDVRDGGNKVASLQDGLAFYLKDVDLRGVTSVTARAYAGSTNTALSSSLEIYLDKMDGPMIANCVITNTKLATSDGTARYGDFKSAMVPVNDGELHDIYAVVNFPDDFRYDILSLDFGTGEEGPVVVRDGEVVDIYSDNFTWKAGEYTLYSASESLPIAALYDADGKAVAAALLSEKDGTREGSFTLSEDMTDAALRIFHWKDMASMEPKTPEYVTYQAPITIGCVGDSITRELNDETDNDDMLSYPKFLGLALGSRYEVKNFGRGGATIGGYYDAAAYGRAVEAACDIYVIQLGTNDAREGHSTNLKTEYQRLIDGLLEANPEALIYLCLPYPVFNEGNYGIQEDILVNDIIPVVQEVAEENGLPTINVHDEVLAHPRVDEFDRGDNIHPKDVGMLYLAEIIENAILGK